MKRAFLLVEVIVALVGMSCMFAAMTPMITRKLKNTEVSIANLNNDSFQTECPKWPGCVFYKEDACSLCSTSCADNEFVNTPDCTCLTCDSRMEKCYSCTPSKCKKCFSGYGITVSTPCELCKAGNYSDGSYNCKAASKGYYVPSDGLATQTKCAEGHYTDTEGYSACCAGWCRAAAASGGGEGGSSDCGCSSGQANKGSGGGGGWKSKECEGGSGVIVIQIN